MLLHIPNILTSKQVAECRAALDRLEWKDGRVTAGRMATSVKNNAQAPENHPVARGLSDMISVALNQNETFLAASLPLRILPPMFNRYSVGQSYGGHVDATARQVWGTQQRIRTDLSATLFLSSPDEYDGGELVIEDVPGHKGIKLPAGDMVLYASTSVHRVEPVTRGARVASFFWVQSMVRGDAQRGILYELDTAMHQLGQENPEHKTLLKLSGVYYNLLRLWSDT